MIDGANNVTLSDFTILQGTIVNRDAGDHHALIEVLATSQNSTDITISNVYFGPCIGDAFRTLAGSSSLFIQNVKLLNFTMRTQGHPQGAGGLGLGSRSGISLGRGFKSLEIGDFYIEGAKNSVLDMEATSASIMSELNVHDGTFNNAFGQTYDGVAFAAFAASAPLLRSRMHNVSIIDSSFTIQNTQDCDVSNVTIWTTGLGPMAVVGQGDQALVYLTLSNQNLKLNETRIIRDVGALAGPLFRANSTSNGRITIDGGEWRSETSCGTSNGPYVDLQGVLRPTFRNLHLQLNACRGLSTA